MTGGVFVDDHMGYVACPCEEGGQIRLSRGAEAKAARVRGSRSVALICIASTRCGQRLSVLSATPGGLCTNDYPTRLRLPPAHDTKTLRCHE